jgi:flagellar motor switch protein FliG
MKPLQKAAAFLVMIGLERGRSVLDLMDSDEIKTVVDAIGKLPALTPAMQQLVWREFAALGYKEDMNPSDTLNAIRGLFNGSKISERAAAGWFPK